MPLQSSAVGTVVSSSVNSVPTRWLLPLAAVLGVDAERYVDDARPSGLEALPFICTRFEWLLQRQLRVHPALGLNENESRRGVHFVQDSTFVAPLRPGMNVEAKGEIREIREVRAGALIRYAYTLRNLETGTDLVRTQSISIYRDVHVVENAAKLPEEDRPKDGDQAVDFANAECERITVSRAFPQLYTECADIWNPIHTERRVALAAGLPDIIVHGTATWALAGCALMRAYEARLERKLSRLSGKFAGNVVPPCELSVRHAPATSQQPGVIAFDVLGPGGQTVLSNGLAVFDQVFQE